MSQLHRKLGNDELTFTAKYGLCPSSGESLKSMSTLELHSGQKRWTLRLVPIRYSFIFVSDASRKWTSVRFG